MPGPFLLDTPDPTWRTERSDRTILHIAPAEDLRMAFAHSIVDGLSQQPRTLDSRFLYDQRGSELYERITEQPEYYLTRAEDEILAREARRIREIVGDVTLIELGSGSSTKTRHLLDAWTADSTRPARYVPIDISPSALAEAARTLVDAYPTLTVEGLASTYEDGLRHVGVYQPALISFLGSSIGNFTPALTDRFLDGLADALQPGGYFLLGVDLVKDPRVLELAYDDPAGWTRRFTRNLFERMRSDLGLPIPDGAADHVAYYNDRLERIEIFARFDKETRFELLGHSFRIAKGEMVRTEISRKYRIAEVAADAARFGFELADSFTDSEERFGLLLLRRRVEAPYKADQRVAWKRWLERQRNRTFELIAPLSDFCMQRQHDSRMSPIVWDLLHIAEFEHLWLVRNLADRGRHEIPAVVDAMNTPRSGRGELELPDRSECADRLNEVRSEVLERIANGTDGPADPLCVDGFVYRMIAQHEAQHQETMLAAINLIPDEPYVPGFREALPERPDDFPDGMVLVPGGTFLMGTDDRTFAYDNERPAHPVHLDDYRIDIAPVTNGQFLAFIADGGYRRPDLWTEEGAEWLARNNIYAPEFWVRDGEHWRRRQFGQLVEIDPQRPVMHVSAYEAEAYAKWAGKRLPTEAEWEKAAAWDAARRRSRIFPWGDEKPGPDHANLDQDLLGTTPVGSYPRGRSFYGCHQMLGETWEWTSSTFQPYPGFEAWPYPEYSEVFFGDDYRVLRGSSWATRRIVARNTFRNWDYPMRRQIFAGFRCAKDG